jgi:hypothetical protein
MLATMLTALQVYGEAAQQLARVLNNYEEGVSLSEKGPKKSRRELWLLLCELISKNPNAAKGMQVDRVIRSGLSQYVVLFPLPFLAALLTASW